MNRKLPIFLFCLLWSFWSPAQNKTEYTQSRILILLDESSSMIQKWAGGREKIKVANEIILKLMDSVYSVNPDVEFSLRVFGNQHPVDDHDCTDTRNEVPFSKYNKTQMEFRLDDLHPLGVTAIAYSLSEAADHDLIDEKRNAYSIVLVTDGGESCGGDICGVMQKLIRNKIYFRPYILNLEDAPELQKEYSCMGEYLQVTQKADISKAVGKIVDAFRPMLKITKTEYSTLRAINPPSILKVSTPKIKDRVMIDTLESEKIIPTKNIDTVAVAPKPIKHSIDTIAEVKRPTALKMKRLKVSQIDKLYTYVPKKYKYELSAIADPEIKSPEIEQPIVMPTPAKLTLVPIRKYKKLKIEKPETVAPDLVTVTPPPAVITASEVLPPLPKPAKLTALPVKKPKKIKVIVREDDAPFLSTIEAPVTKPVVIETPPPPPVPVKLTKIAPAKTKTVTTTPSETKPLMPVAVTAPDLKFKEQDPPVVVQQPKPEVKKLNPVKFKMHLLYGGTFFDADIKPVKIAPPPSLVYPKNNPVTTTEKPKTTAAPAPVAKTGEYSVEHEDAAETTLEIYLTNGKGKFYQTTPEVTILNPVTNKEVKKFHRFVDAAGNPDPITDLAVGKYDLVMAGRDDLLAHVDLIAHKRNKVYIKVKNYSLFFYYKGAADKPVNEFSAEVIQRNVANGRQVVQKCTEKIEYEPGNYHIIINTFPTDIRNIDLSDDYAGGIAIDQPGFVKFTPEVNTPTVTIWKQAGERFLNFYTLKLNDPSSQHLRIQPGKYQVQYSNGISNTSASNRVISFEIKSNEDTEVILKK